MRMIEKMSLSDPPEEASRFSQRVEALLDYSVIALGFVSFVNSLRPKLLIDPDYVGRKYRASGTSSPLQRSSAMGERPLPAYPFKLDKNSSVRAEPSLSSPIIAALSSVTPAFSNC